MNHRIAGEPIDPFGDGEAPLERDAAGRFMPGCKGGPGNPFVKKTAAIRAAVYKAVTAADLREIVKALVTRAKTGDVLAAREVLDRLLGKARQTVALAEAEELPALTFCFVEAKPPAGWKPPDAAAAEAGAGKTVGRDAESGPPGAGTGEGDGPG